MDININGHIALWLTRMQGHESLTLIMKIGQGMFRFLIFLYRRPLLRLWLSGTYCPPDYPKYATTNHWRSVDAHFQDGVGCTSLFCLIVKAANRSTKDSNVPMSIFLHLTVAYINATINHKTPNSEPEIGTNWSSKTRHNPWVDEYKSGFGLPRGSGSGFCLGPEPNWPVIAVQTQTAGRLPRPIANTRQLILQLFCCSNLCSPVDKDLHCCKNLVNLWFW